MAVTQSGFGRVEVWDDFAAPDNDLTWGTGTIKVGNFGFISVNEGTLEWTVDEGGGILAITTDTGDDDNAVLMAGTYRPDVMGPLVTEWRFKNDSITEGAIFVGFTETLALATPVMPAEFATATMTYNGTGQMIGANFDPDGTTDDFRALSGDAGAVVGTNAATRAALAAAGIRATDALIADEWFIVRTELSQDGVGEVWVGHKNRGLDLIVKVTGAPVVNPMYAICMVENRGANANVFEVDYGYACGGRDWEVQ